MPPLLPPFEADRCVSLMRNWWSKPTKEANAAICLLALCDLERLREDLDETVFVALAFGLNILRALSFAREGAGEQKRRFEF